MLEAGHIQDGAAAGTTRAGATAVVRLRVGPRGTVCPAPSCGPASAESPATVF